MGLKESRKYAIGSLHENGGGKFEIVDRWYEEDTDAIMLKYRFLADGRVETNKEANVNSSEWKWKKVRGLAGKPSEAVGLPKEELEENFANLTERFDKGLEAVMENKNNIQQLKDALAEQQKMLIEMLSAIHIQQKQIESLINDRSVINKLLEKI